MLYIAINVCMISVFIVWLLNVYDDMIAEIRRVAQMPGSWVATGAAASAPPSPNIHLGTTRERRPDFAVPG